MRGQDSGELPLAEAAMRLRQSWAQTWRLALTGELDARKVGGRWFVTLASVAKIRDGRAAQAASNT